MTDLREAVAPAPRGRDRLPWYGPGFIWIVASIGSGNVLFTPRVGSRYEYTLLWAALLVMLVIWVVLREVGRYTLVSGRSILSGYHALPGPRGWAVWFIFVPQLLASALIVAGIAALVGSALMIALPGTQAMYAVGLTLLSCVLVVSGRYQAVERVSKWIAAVLIVSAMVTAAVVRPDLSAFAAGLAPTLPDDFDAYFVVPWLSFVVAGPAAVLWYSYWLMARGYGGGTGDGRLEGGAQMEGDAHGDRDGDRCAGGEDGAGERGGAGPGGGASDDADAEGSPRSAPQATARLRGWMRIMAVTAGIGVVGGGLVSLSFLVLGAELLAPQGVVPEGIEVARDLSRLLADVWGPAGFWLLILCVSVALWSSILANQDGFGRLYADATLLLIPHRCLRWASHIPRLARGEPGDAARELRLKLANFYSVVVLTLAPIAVFLLARDPVRILSIGGVLAAAHMPVIVFLTLYVNRARLPEAFRPGRMAVAGMLLAGGFYAAVAVIFFAGMAGSDT